MSRLEERFRLARAAGRATLIGYLPAGFPSVAGAVTALRTVVDAGVDIVEIGWPYSDPLLDGPTIQQAVNAAITAGTTPTDVLRTVEALASTGTLAVVMTYWNPVERYGVDAFTRDLAAAGGVGVITTDILPEEAGEWLTAAAAHRIDPVFLVAPSSTDDRIQRVAAVCRGFIYAASTMGVTGARNRVADTAASLVTRVRRASPLPVAVGLGVGTGEQAAEVAGYADGVIVGSAFVRRLLDDDLVGLGRLAAELADGVRRGGQTSHPPVAG